MSAPDRDLITTADAEADLLSIVLYGVQTWDRERSLEYVTAITKVFDLIHFPELGRRVANLGERMRFIRVRDHIVFNEHDERAVTILRILHGRMEPEFHL